MAIARERGKLIFRRTERALSRLSSEPDTEAVHRFRTSVLRLEILLEQLSPGRDRKRKKLLQRLRRIRKGAGKLRDIDVQLGALRTLKIPLEPRRKRQFVQALLEIRAKRELKLRKLLKKRDILELRRRLARVAKEADFGARIDPLTVARRMLEAVPVSPHPADETTLHCYRMVVKRARYAAEFAPPTSASKLLIAQLKRLQYAIGHWHDWFALTQTAVKRLGDVTQSALVAALHTVTRAKFRQAVAAVSPAPAAATAVDEPSAPASAVPAQQPGAAAYPFIRQARSLR